MRDRESAARQPQPALDDEARSRIERTARRFRMALEATVGQSTPADLVDYLPRGDDALRTPMLERLIATDLEVRAARGEKPTAEQYLARFPELKDKSSSAIALLVAEFNARKLAGEAVEREEFKRRFPALYQRFNETLSNHEYRTMDSGSFVANPSVEPAASSPSRSAGTPLELHSSASQFGSAGYQLIRRIGQGSYGEVWSAEAPGGVDVAIKMVHRPLTDQGYRREYEALELVKRLRHPFLLQTHAYWSEADRLIVATELADCSLRDRLNDCQEAGETGIPIVELCGYLRESASALDFLSSKDILHRDIKPENILIVNGHAKVADFGVARAMPKEDASDKGAASGQGSNMGATVIGTPHFMSPEVWKSSFSKQLDQYSLAVAFVQLRTGKSPFAGDSLKALMFGHMTQAPRLDGLSEAEQKVVLKALSKNPDERFGSCTEFVDAIEKAVGLRKDPRASRWPLAAAAAVIALIGIGLLANWLVQRKDFRVALPDEVRVAAGDDATVRLMIDANSSWSGQPTVAFEKIPGVDIRVDDFDASGANTALHFRVTDLALVADKPLEREVAVRVTRNGKEVPSKLRLTIEQPSFAGRDWLTPQPGARFVEIDKRIFCTVAALKDARKAAGKPMLFRAVTDGGGKPFYIMENKVCNRWFAVFAKEQGAKLSASKWTTGAVVRDKPLGIANGDWPVYSVTALEAAQFAAWLLPGGTLPTKEQWIAAAKSGRTKELKGPYAADWRPNQPKAFELIGVNRAELGPLPIGAAADRSPIGIRDMAGNGMEWTSSGKHAASTGSDSPFELRADSKLVGSDFIKRVGRSYRQVAPLPYSEIEEPNIEEWFHDDADVSFRVAFVP